MIRQEILSFIRRVSMKRPKRILLSFLIVLGLVSIVITGLEAAPKPEGTSKSIAGSWGFTASGLNVPPPPTISTVHEPTVAVGTFFFEKDVDGVGNCTILIRTNAGGVVPPGGGPGACIYDLDPDGTGNGIGVLTIPVLPGTIRFVLVDNGSEIRFIVEAPPGSVVSGVAKRR